MNKGYFKIEAAECPDGLFVDRKFNVLLNPNDFICLEEGKDGNKKWAEVICKKDKKYYVSVEEAERISKELSEEQF